MEHENEEENGVTLGGVVVVTVFCATMFAVGYGIGHVSNKLADRIEDRIMAKKYAAFKETSKNQTN